MAQRTVPYLPTINPPIWELGHVGWFQEYWCLRSNNDGELSSSLLEHADRWFDSAKVGHQSRWSLDLPSLETLRDYLAESLKAVLKKLQRAPDTDEGLYFFRLVLFHEMMHAEAFAYTCQTMAYPLPNTKREQPQGKSSEDCRVVADSALANFSLGSTTSASTTSTNSNSTSHSSVESKLAKFPLSTSIRLGSSPGQGFAFDNEKWAHGHKLAPFEIELQPTSVREFEQFVSDGGYANAKWWDPEYFAYLKSSQRTAPFYWREQAGGFSRRWFDQCLPLNLDEPMMHVSAFEAEAFCRWAGKRLPTKAEWQYAAEHDPQCQWGDKVWEWTSTVFEAFPGFSADPYKEYSEPWFGTHRVVRGGSFVTPKGMLSTKFRNLLVSV